jgi:two-component system sensor kinase FixL
MIRKGAQRGRTPEDARARARQQEALAALGSAALASDDIRQFTAEALRRLADILNVEYVAAWELQADGRTLLLRSGVGWRTGCVGHAVVEMGRQSPAGFALMVGEPVIIADLRAERRFSAPAFLREHDVVSGMTVAVAGQGRPYGVLGVHTAVSREFSTDEVLFVRAVANVLAAAIRNEHADSALRDSEARLRAVVDTAVEGIITIDECGIVESINPAACRLFGYARKEVIGRNVSRLMPEPYRSQHDAYLEAYLHTGRARIIGIGREVVGRRKDGTIFPLDLSVSEFQVAGRRMFTGVVRDITDRRRLEREILEAAAQEQQRIGQDLHDGLCQELTGISFAMEVLGQKLAGRAAPETASIREVAELVDQTISHARSLAHGLQPVTLDASGLASALQELAAKTQSLFHVACLLVSDGPVLVHDNVVATHVFRIAQEAIGNAVKHGKAKTVVLDLSAQGGDLRLSVTDDGVGLGSRSADGKGIGLQTMLYRARVVGGALDIRPGERGGTVVVCTIPNACAVIETANSERPANHGGETEAREQTASEQRDARAEQSRAKTKGLPRGRSSHRPRKAR